MKVINLEIHNILSVEHASISFGDEGMVLVEGFDFDTNRANGAGKSAIFNALSYALFDKMPRNISKTEILRHGTKSGFAMATILTDAGENICIKRSRPTGVEFFKDGVKIDMTQQEFESKMSLVYEQFLCTMYNAQDSKDRFMYLDDRGKKDFMLKIMNLESFDGHKKALSAEISAISQKREVLKAKIEGYKNTIAAYKQQVVNVSDIEESIKALETEIKSLNSKVKELEVIQPPDTSKYAAIEAQVDEKLINFASIRIEANNKRAEVASLQQMKAQAHCPDCGIGLKSANGSLVKVSDEAKVKEQISLLVAKIKELEDELLKEAEVKELLKKIRQKKNDDYQEYNVAQIQASSTRSLIQSKTSQITSLRNQVTKNQTIKDKVQEIVADATTSQEEIIKLTGEEDVLKTVASFFDPTGAPAYIMDSVIDSFNDAVADYVSTIWPNATYSLQSFKENKDKSISTKFSESLLIGGNFKSVGSLSGGEFRALSLATDFAMIDVLANKFGVNMSPVILDEPFNGLDVSGKELVIDVLNQISTKRQIWVVDHSSESKALFSRTVMVEKKNGISNIKDV